MWTTILLLMGLAFPALAGSPFLVIRPVANLYAKPTTDAPVVSQAIYATRVEAVGEQPGWRRVRTPDGYPGWMQSATLLAETGAAYATQGKVARVRSLFANLYAEPDLTRHQPLLMVPFETRLEVIAEPEPQDRRWIELRLPDRRTAWIQRGDVSFDDRALTIDQTVRLARRFLGLPYRWGGTSTFGYDCSGFTQMLCRARGFRIPRDAAPQAAWKGMRVITREELEPGDLLYFGQSPDKITHTGFYIGGGEFIHATAYRRPVIQISELDDPHWNGLLVACRRLVGVKQ